MKPIINSINNPLIIKSISEFKGKIGLSSCPGKKGLSRSGKVIFDRDLNKDIDCINSWGADFVITLLTKEELEEFSLLKLPKKFNKIYSWHHLPIEDRNGLDSDSEEIWNELRNLLAKETYSGKNILIHCSAGIGRTGTIVTSLIKTISPEIPIPSIINKLRSIQKGAVQTKDQEEWLLRYHNYTKKINELNYSYNIEYYLSLLKRYRQKDFVVENDILDEMNELWEYMDDSRKSRILNALTYNLF